VGNELSFYPYGETSLNPPNSNGQDAQVSVVSLQDGPAAALQAL